MGNIEITSNWLRKSHWMGCLNTVRWHKMLWSPQVMISTLLFVQILNSIDKLCSISAQLWARAFSAFGLIPPPKHSSVISQLPVIWSEYVRTFFMIISLTNLNLRCVCMNLMQQCALRHINNNNIYLSSLWSNLVLSKHVRTFFDRTQSQESKSEVCTHEFYEAIYIKTQLDNIIHPSSQWSDLNK